jgi:hypothetical protein
MIRVRSTDQAGRREQIKGYRKYSFTKRFSSLHVFFTDRFPPTKGAVNVIKFLRCFNVNSSKSPSYKTPVSHIKECFSLLQNSFYPLKGIEQRQLISKKSKSPLFFLSYMSHFRRVSKRRLAACRREAHTSIREIGKKNH